jgi:hypothetical protein
LRDRSLKNHSVTAESVERGGLNVFGSVATHVVGTNCVDGDENHIGLGFAGRIACGGLNVGNAEDDTQEELEVAVQ